MSENTILVALDGSELSERELPYAVMMAKATNASIHLTTVWEEGERALVAGLPDVAESVFKKGDRGRHR
jgi:nucleotide-binding universal stress UspA family protein